MDSGKKNKIAPWVKRNWIALAALIISLVSSFIDIREMSMSREQETFNRLARRIIELRQEIEDTRNMKKEYRLLLYFDSLTKSDRAVVEDVLITRLDSILNSNVLFLNIADSLIELEPSRAIVNNFVLSSDTILVKSQKGRGLIRKTGEMLLEFRE